MAIKNMLGRNTTENNTSDAPQTEHSNFYHEVKRKIHGRLVERNRADRDGCLVQEHS